MLIASAKNRKRKWANGHPCRTDLLPKVVYLLLMNKGWQSLHPIPFKTQVQQCALYKMPIKVDIISYAFSKSRNNVSRSCLDFIAIVVVFQKVKMLSRIDRSFRKPV
jgi:hypothetical protein